MAFDLTAFGLFEYANKALSGWLLYHEESYGDYDNYYWETVDSLISAYKETIKSLEAILQTKQKEDTDGTGK